MVKSVRVVCAHDCPDMCSLIAHVEDGKVVRVQGDPDHPYTAGFACGKVNRDADLVNSPERIKTPLKRSGPKGSGQFTPISWDQALDEIAGKWKAIIKESGPLALLGYAYSAHQGLMNRGLVNGLFHALGASRLLAGTVCDTCCEEAWNVTVGPVGGADPEDVVHSDLMISWGADLAATNVHFWALAEEQRKKRGMPIVVIDPRRTRSAKAADLYLPIRIGTDAALALGIMHILVRDKLANRDYIARHTLGFDRVEREVLPKFTPARTAEITGLAVADIEKLAAMYGRAKSALIRLGEGMTHLAAETFKAYNGIALMQHVVYRGGTPALNDVLAGTIPMTSATVTQALPQWQGGLVKALGVTSTERHRSLPGVPTFREQGFDLVVTEWYGLLAPAGTPKPIVAKLNAEVRRILALDLGERVSAIDLAASSPEELSAFVKSEIERWSPVIKKLELKAQ